MVRRWRSFSPAMLLVQVSASANMAIRLGFSSINPALLAGLTVPVTEHLSIYVPALQAFDFYPPGGCPDFGR